MEDLKIAYQSLENAKREEHTLKENNRTLKKIYSRLKRYCIHNNPIKNQSIAEEISKLKKDTNEEALNIVLAFLVYGISFTVIDLISLFILANTIVIPISILVGIIYLPGYCSKYIINIFKNNQHIKMLSEIEEILDTDPKYRDQSLENILTLIGEDKELLKTKIDAISTGIIEYEEALNAVNHNLAEEILADSGIEASITLNSSMKVLAKRYDEKN